jgi:hypothetical protein
MHRWIRHARLLAGALLVVATVQVPSGAAVAASDPVSPSASVPLAPGVVLEPASASAPGVMPPMPPADRSSVGKSGRAAAAAAVPRNSYWSGPYRIASYWDDGKNCLEIEGFQTHNGARAQQWDCISGNRTQLWWRYTAGGDGNVAYTFLANYNSGKCLEIDAWSKANFAPATQWDCHFGNNQQWVHTSTSNTLVNYHSGKCLDVPQGQTANGVHMQQYTCNGLKTQAWAYQNSYSTWVGPYQLVNYNSGKCLEIDNFQLHAGARAQQFACISGNPTQQWMRWSVGNTQWFYNVNSGKCLEIDAWSKANGAPAQQWDCTFSLTQTWLGPYQSFGGELRNNNSYKCLEIPSFQTGNQVAAWQWDCLQNDTQRWVVRAAV